MEFEAEVPDTLDVREVKVEIWGMSLVKIGTTKALPDIKWVEQREIEIEEL